MTYELLRMRLSEVEMAKLVESVSGTPQEDLIRRLCFEVDQYRAKPEGPMKIGPADTLRICMDDAGMGDIDEVTHEQLQTLGFNHFKTNAWDQDGLLVIQLRDKTLIDVGI